MGLWRAALDVARSLLDPTPAVVFMADDTPRPVDQMISEMWRGSGRVTRSEAFTVPGILRGRNLICSVATLPLVQYDQDNRPERNPLLEQFDPDVPNVVHLAQTIEDLLCDAIAWWVIRATDHDDYPVKVRRVDPNTVSLQPPAGRTPAPLPSGEEPRGSTVWVDGVETPASRVIRFDSPNPGICRAAGLTVRRAVALSQTAAMYADDPRPLDYFTPTEGADPVDDDEVETMLAKWLRVRKARGTGYVPAALTYNSVDSPFPADLQLVELQKQAALDTANMIGLDPEDLGISTTSRTYQNAVDRRIDRINDVLSAYMRAITDRLSMGDVTRRGHNVRFDLDDYLRADPKTRWEVYQIAHGLGATDAQEIRTEERMPPRRITPPAAPAAPSNVVPLRGRDQVAAAADPASLTFDQDTLVLDMPSLETFAVDVAQRTITGTIVPFGRVAAKNGRRYRFRPGSLQFAAANRVKLLRDHDRTNPLGVGVRIEQTSDRYVGTFSVAPGPDGDRALALAAHGTLDGLSPGVWFDVDGGDLVLMTDDVYDVARADLREVSLTALPSFDDSRLTSVAAHSDERNHMTAPAPAPASAPTPAPAPAPVSPAAPAPAGQTFSLDQLAQALGMTATPVPAPAQFGADQLAALRAMLGQPAAPEQRQTVDPTHGFTGQIQVIEPAPYRVDRRGNLRIGTHDFSQDVIRAGKGDLASRQRAEEFIAEQFDGDGGEQFAVTKANAAALNPNRQRPDMYVDQREFRYPIWEAVNKGTLEDATPFVFPKFNTATGLVAAHSEGVEPTPGAYTATSQTVTPTPNSGRVEITRETWDQGGNPQVSNLIWRQMRRAWYEALEAAAVAELNANAASITDINLGIAVVDSALDQAITAAFAALQFVRGGFSMDTMFTQIDLYLKLVAAKDTAGRRLYPSLGAQNALGTVRTKFGAIDINGVLGLPAWALAATGSVAASSYLFDSESVHGWASAPQRLDFQYRVSMVDVGIWGYKATAISDLNGVREVVYDPV